MPTAHSTTSSSPPLAPWGGSRHALPPPTSGSGHAGQARRAPPNKLSEAEAEAVLRVLRSERVVDASPAQVFHLRLDEGTYLASTSTYYRLLRAAGEVRERRRHASHRPRVRRELVATQPLVVWSWDITKLKGVVLDIFSRYVVAWCVAPPSRARWPRS